MRLLILVLVLSGGAALGQVCGDACEAACPGLGCGVPPATGGTGELPPQPEARILFTCTSVDKVSECAMEGRVSGASNGVGTEASVIADARNGALVKANAACWRVASAVDGNVVSYELYLEQVELKKSEPWSTKTEWQGHATITADVRCTIRRPNPAMKTWVEQKARFDENLSKAAQQLAAFKNCESERAHERSMCVARCRPCDAKGDQQPNDQDATSASRSGSNASNTGSKSGANSSSRSGGAKSSGSVVPENSGSANAAGSAATSTSSSGGGQAVAALGGLAGAGAGGSTAAGTSKGSAASDYEALKADVRASQNAWVPPVAAASALGISVALIGLLAAINDGLPKTDTDLQKPGDFARPWAWLLGIDVLGSWWARPQLELAVGYQGFIYAGEYVSTPVIRGTKLGPATIPSHLVGATFRLGVIRASLGVTGGYGNLLNGHFPAADAVNQTQVFMGGQGSAGIQVFQGLFSPYVEWRHSWFEAVHPVRIASGRAALEGILYMPPANTLVIGNTFNFSSLFATQGPLRRSLVIDISYPLIRHPTLTGDFRLTVGLSVTWF